MSYGSKIIADWLENATYGVGAALAALPLGDDATPDTPTVYNEMEDGWVGRAEVPKEIQDAGPYLLVYQTGDQTYTDARPQRMSATVGAASGSCSYVIAYGGRNSDTAEGTLEATHTLRAARGSVWLLADEINADSRSLYGFALETLTAVSQAAMNEERGDSLISGAVTVTWTTRETAPFPT